MTVIEELVRWWKSNATNRETAPNQKLETKLLEQGEVVLTAYNENPEEVGDALGFLQGINQNKNYFLLKTDGLAEFCVNWAKTHPEPFLRALRTIEEGKSWETLLEIAWHTFQEQNVSNEMAKYILVSTLGKSKNIYDGINSGRWNIHKNVFQKIHLLREHSDFALVYEEDGELNIPEPVTFLRHGWCIIPGILPEAVKNSKEWQSFAPHCEILGKADPTKPKAGLTTEEIKWSTLWPKLQWPYTEENALELYGVTPAEIQEAKDDSANTCKITRPPQGTENSYEYLGAKILVGHQEIRWAGRKKIAGIWTGPNAVLLQKQSGMTKEVQAIDQYLQLSGITTYLVQQNKGTLKNLTQLSLKETQANIKQKDWKKIGNSLNLLQHTNQEAYKECLEYIKHASRLLELEIRTQKGRAGRSLMEQLKQWKHIYTHHLINQQYQPHPEVIAKLL